MGERPVFEELPHEEPGGPYSCCRCLADTWNDDDWCNDCINESRLVALKAIDL